MSIPISRAARRVLYIPRRCFSSSRQSLAERVRLVEVGPRDGLQNEKSSIPVDTKIELIRRLATTGVDTIEAGSFVHPKWVPQMANSDKILEHILSSAPPSAKPITYQWLLPNIKGLDNFFSVHEKNANSITTNGYPTPPPSPTLEAADQQFSTSSPAPHEVSIFLAATEAFSKRNTNCSIAESLARFAPLITSSTSRGIPVRAYISVALGCPYEGPLVSPATVTTLTTKLLEMGACEISVADTTGMGTAPRTRLLLRTLKEAGVDMSKLAFHFHDTYGMALVNTMEALDAGIRVFDASVSGLGGCPYSPGATGNVATEDVVHLCESLGMQTGVDLVRMAEVGEWISGELGRANASSAGKAVLAKVRQDVKPGST